MINRRVFLASMAGAAVAQTSWTALFDGRSLKGWKASGKADWSVDDGCIVGRQGAGMAPGDLFTEAQFDNFELECEWRMKWPGNSGIWFRYTSPKSAYQADFIDEPAHPGVLSGSLYCMGKAFIAENRDASSLNRDGWNKMSIRAAGDQFTIHSNGKQVVKVRDSSFPGPGSIGIQVHPGKHFDGMEVRVRNIRARRIA